jgi:uncharacterized membrane protein YqjE
LFEAGADLSGDGRTEFEHFHSEKELAMATARTAMDKRGEVPAEIENLPVLVTRLGDDVMQLFDTKISLLKVEVQEDVNAFLRSSIVIVAASMVALVGVSLVSVAIALGISTLFSDTNLTQTGRYALSFVIVGAIYLLIGTITALVMKGRLAKQSLVPNRTVEEFRKDKQWLQKEV